jgi:hypothetical protein
VATAARSCRAERDVPSVNVLDALRRHEAACRSRCALDPEQVRVLRQMLACRTAALGAHLCVCSACGWRAPAYNSCRNRHCPQCQGAATADWLAGQQERMLDTPHFQVVFTLPAELRPLAFANQEIVYTTLFRAASTLLGDLADKRLGARLGVTAVLHTWTRDLEYHPHVHLLVTAGGLSRDGSRWVRTREGFLFPERVMGMMFRGRVLEALNDALRDGRLRFPPDTDARHLRSTLRQLAKRHARWVVHVEPPAGRPAAHVARYLARYVKRVAISDARMVSVTDTHVVFRGRTGLVEVEGHEFVRRFLLHVLPKGLRKVRHFGLYAPGTARQRLNAARALLPATSPPVEAAADADTEETVSSLEACPACHQKAVRRVHPQSPAFAAILRAARALRPPATGPP